MNAEGFYFAAALSRAAAIGGRGVTDEVGATPGIGIGPAFGNQQLSITRRQRQTIPDVVSRQADAVDGISVFPGETNREDLVRMATM